MSDSPVSTLSSGDPYADLGMSDPDTRLVKAKLALRITAVMSERRLSESALAQPLNLDQPEVAAIVRGRLKGFSLEQLMSLVNQLDMDIEIRVTPHPEPERRARMMALDFEESMFAVADARHPHAVRFDWTHKAGAVAHV